MFLTNERKVLAKIAAVITLIQGLTWLGLCITSLVISKYVPSSMQDDTYDSYTTYISWVIYNQFINGNDSNIITPTSFNILLWIYTVLSAFWIAASIDLFAALRRNYKRQSYVSIILGSIILTTSVIDVVYVALLARDLSDCEFSFSAFTVTSISSSTTDTLPTTDLSTTEPSTSDYSTSDPSTSDSSTSDSPTSDDSANFQVNHDALEAMVNILNTGAEQITGYDCKLATGIVMTIVARGYLLWLINVIISIGLIIIGTKALNLPNILAYGNSIPRIKTPRPDKMESMHEPSFYEDSPPPPFFGGSSSRYSTPVALGKNRDSKIYY